MPDFIICPVRRLTPALGQIVAVIGVLLSLATARAADNDVRLVIWGDYHLGPAASLQLPDGIMQVSGDFDVAINDPARFDLTNASLQMVGIPNAGPFDIEAMAEDIGFCDLTLPDPNLFSMKRLWIGPSTVSTRFVDNHDNAPGVGNEALYVETLRFEPGTSLDVRGLNLYYITVSPADAGDFGSGVTITDSIGGGGIFALGTDSPVTPINPGTSDNEICDGDSTTLFAEANSGLEIDWYTDDCGISPSNRPLGTFVGTGSPLIVSPLDTTVYWAQSRNPTTGCISRICSDSVTVIVHDNPLCTITSDAVVCTGASELTATVQDAGSDTTYAWVVTGGTITGGQNTPSITYIADDVGTIVLEVTIDKTWSDGDGSTCQTYCQLTIYTDRYVWTGADGSYFTEPSNWDLGIVPGSVPPGGDAIITNATNVNNTCVLDDPGGSHVMCNVKIQGTGSGRQILRIGGGSVLTTTVKTLINPGGEVELRGGEIAGGPVDNNSNTLSGYGRITADIDNTGLIRTSPLRLLELLGGELSNQGSGMLRVVVGSGTLVESPVVYQAAGMEVQSNATLVFSIPLTNGAGGDITLLNGTISADGITNDAGGLIEGFGTIQTSLDNDGNLVTIADAHVVGDLANDGTIIIQSGLLTVTGTLSGGGTIIGGLGGRDGAASGLIVTGDFLPSARDPAAFDLTDATVWMRGEGEQHLEVMAADVGGRNIRLPDAGLFSIGMLHIGPAATTVVLTDQYDNSAGYGTEVLYVDRLQIDPGATLDLAGRTLFYRSDVSGRSVGKATETPVIDSLGGGRLVQIGTSAKHLR